MPPTIDQWFSIPVLSYIVLQKAWAYIVLPLDFILGLTLVRNSISTIQNITGVFRKK